MRTRSYKFESGLNAFYYNTKVSVSKRGYSFELTLNEASILSQKVCTYCGKELSQVLRSFPNFKYNGIDRVDNSLGYVDGNCAPCCFICNKMKSVLSKEEFMEHLDKIWTRVG